MILRQLIGWAHEHQGDRRGYSTRRDDLLRQTMLELGPSPAMR